VSAVAGLKNESEKTPEASEEDEESSQAEEDDVFEKSHSLASSGQAIYKEVNLSLKFSNKPTSDVQETRREDFPRRTSSAVEEPRIIPSSARSLSQSQLLDSLKPSQIQMSHHRIQELLQPERIEEREDSPVKPFTYKVMQESPLKPTSSAALMNDDLKSLQQKILNLEAKLQLQPQHSSDVREGSSSSLKPSELKLSPKQTQNVHFDLGAFHAFTDPKYQESEQ
jgi:hypothetical protein